MLKAAKKEAGTVEDKNNNDQGSKEPEGVDGPTHSAGDKNLAGCLVALLLVGGLAWFIWSGLKGTSLGPSPARQAERELRSLEIDVRLDCSRLVRASVRDPETVKIPHVQAHTTATAISYFWGRDTRFVRARNALGNELPVQVLCNYSRTNEQIDWFVVNGETIVDRR